MEPQHEPMKLRFDPTINAGHVLTLIGMIGVGFAGWSTLDKRVLVLEEAKNYQQKRDESQDTAINEKLGDIKEKLRELKQSLEAMNKK